MATLDQMIMSLDRIGVADIILPFILVFTIVYAVLKKTEIMGKTNDKFNVMLAMVMGLAVVFPHVTGRGPDVVPVINNALPNVAAVAVAVIMLLILLGVWGEKWSFAGRPIASFITIFAIVAVVYIFGSSAGWFWRIPEPLRFLENPDTQALIVAILVFALIIGYIVRDPEQAKKDSFGKKFNDYFNIFEKGGGGGHGGGHH